MVTRALLIFGIILYGAGIGSIVMGSTAREVLPIAAVVATCFSLYVLWGGEDGN